MNHAAKIILFFCGVLVIAGLAAAGWRFARPVGRPAAQNFAAQETYNALRGKYLAILQERDPRAALAQLNADLPSHSVVMRSCHALVHELGRAAYEKYKDFTAALSYGDSTCNTGYMHGVIEARFAQSVDIKHDLQAVCEGVDFGRCHHGVGHGVMYYTGNDLVASLNLCKTFSRIDAQNYCSQGVFMENFNTDQKLHASKFLQADNPFFPCAEQDKQFKDICYFYAPIYYLTLHDFDYQNALSWCDTAETPYKAACARGVGSLAMKFNIGKPLYAEVLCSGAKKDFVNFCLDGAVGLYVNNFDSTKKGKQLCGQFQPEHRAACLRAVDVRSALFTD